MIIRKHIPGSVSGIEPQQCEVSSQAELLALDWVVTWGSDEIDGAPFWRYSQSKHGEEYLLMGEWKNDTGHKWWVIGYMSESADLPGFRGINHSREKQKPSYGT